MNNNINPLNSNEEKKENNNNNNNGSIIALVLMLIQSAVLINGRYWEKHKMDSGSFNPFSGLPTALYIVFLSFPMLAATLYYAVKGYKSGHHKLLAVVVFIISSIPLIYFIIVVAKLFIE